jgi:hypothetical protein
VEAKKVNVNLIDFVNKKVESDYNKLYLPLSHEMDNFTSNSKQKAMEYVQTPFSNLSS